MNKLYPYIHHQFQLQFSPCSYYSWSQPKTGSPQSPLKRKRKTNEEKNKHCQSSCDTCCCFLFMLVSNVSADICTLDGMATLKEAAKRDYFMDPMAIAMILPSCQPYRSAPSPTFNEASRSSPAHTVRGMANNLQRHDSRGPLRLGGGMRLRGSLDPRDSQEDQDPCPSGRQFSHPCLVGSPEL